MAKLNKLLEHREAILQKAKECGYYNLSIAASYEEDDFPSNFFFDKKKEVRYSSEDIVKFENYLQDVLEDVGITVAFKSFLQEIMQREPSDDLLYLSDTAIALSELTEEPIEEQFQKKYQANQLLRKIAENKTLEQAPASEFSTPDPLAGSPAYQAIERKRKLSPESESTVQDPVKRVVGTLKPDELEEFINQLNSYVEASRNTSSSSSSSSLRL